MSAAGQTFDQVNKHLESVQESGEMQTLATDVELKKY